MPHSEHGRPRPAGLPVRGVLLLLALAFSSFGCAYYNTFFLARKYFNQALLEEKRNTTGKLSPSAASAYEKAIRQCSKVLQRYDNSKWADDALFLMGRAYFGREEFGQSRRWLDELITTQPKSPLVADAHYWEGRSWLAEDDYDKAGEALQEVLDHYPGYKHRDEVQFYLAEVDAKQDRFADAVTKYEEVIKRYPNSGLVIDAQIRIGDAQFSQKKYDVAQTYYERAMAGTRDPRQRFETRLKAGQAMEKQDHYSDALQTYRAMAEELVPKDKLSRILSGGADAAQMAAANPAGPGQPGNDPYAANPNYDPGDVYNQGNGNSGVNTTAQNYPNLSGTQNTPNAQGNYGQTNPTYAGQNPPASYGQPNNPAYGAQGNQDSRLAVSAAVQANPMASELPRVLLRQGLSLSEMGQNDEAIKLFRSITAAYPRTSEAAEAQYRIGYIQEVYLEDYESARTSYDAARQQGVSTFSDQARRRAEGLARLVALQAADTLKTKGTDPTLTAAEKDFLAAELYYFQQDKTDKAMEQYAAVEQNYPATVFAAKSALARAWILSFAMGDTAAGRVAYMHVEKAYPGSDQAKVAHQVLTGEVPPDEAPPASEPGQTPALAQGSPEAAPELTSPVPPAATGQVSPALTPPTQTDRQTPVAAPPDNPAANHAVATNHDVAANHDTVTVPAIPGGVPVGAPVNPGGAVSANPGGAATNAPATTKDAPVAPATTPSTPPLTQPATQVVPPPPTTAQPVAPVVPPPAAARPVTPVVPPPAAARPVTPIIPPITPTIAKRESTRVVSGTLISPAPPISTSRLAPAGAAGVPKPLSIRNAGPAPRADTSLKQKQKQKKTKSHGIPRRSLRPPADKAPADSTAGRTPKR